MPLLEHAASQEPQHADYTHEQQGRLTKEEHEAHGKRAKEKQDQPHRHQTCHQPFEHHPCGWRSALARGVSVRCGTGSCGLWLLVRPWCLGIPCPRPRGLGQPLAIVLGARAWIAEDLIRRVQGLHTARRLG